MQQHNKEAKVFGPFERTDIRVGEGFSTWVFGYDSPVVLALKQNKPGMATYPSSLAATQEVERKRGIRTELTRILSGLGASNDIVAPVFSVVHERDIKEQGKAITISEVSPWLRDAKPLSKMTPLDLIRLPQESLRDLRSLFEAHLTFIDREVELDLIGYKSKPGTVFEKLWRSVLPLFWSEHIFVAPGGSIKYIDVDSRSGGSGNRKMQRLRTNLSISYLNILLYGKR